MLLRAEEACLHEGYCGIAKSQEGVVEQRQMGNCSRARKGTARAVYLVTESLDLVLLDGEFQQAQTGFAMCDRGMSVPMKFGARMQ